MAEPVIDEPTIEDDDTPVDDADVAPLPDEPDIAEVELSDDDFSSGGGLFSGVEQADDLDGLPDESSPGALASGGSLGTRINEGAARLAVVGLEDGEEKDALNAEFTEVFATFGLGHFGQAFVREYILAPDDDSIDPAWGLAGSAFCCLALVVWMRPDGEEKLERLVGAAGNLTGANK